jgi:tetratricopeptide (TPR) repeat protein
MRTIALSLALFISVHAYAGDPVKLREAFKKSYVAESRGDLAASIKALQDVYDAADYGTNLRLGWLHYSAGAFTESQGYYQKAIELMPASVEARLGMLYPAVALGQWDKVARQYEEILKVDPKNTKALYNLGLIVYGKAQYDKALAYFNTGLNLYPFDYDFNVMTAWTSYRMGKTREARVLFEKALTIAPDDASALEGLGLVK